MVCKGESAEGSGRMCLPFVLQALCALAGPPPYAEPDVEGETDDPKGVPDAKRLTTRVPLVQIRYNGALGMRRDGQERDDRDDLSSEIRQHVASRGHGVSRYIHYVTHLSEVDRQCPDNGHELLTRSVIAAVAEKHENTARDGESRMALISGGAGGENCYRSVRPRNDGIRNDGSNVPVTGRLLEAVGRSTGDG